MPARPSPGDDPKPRSPTGSPKTWSGEGSPKRNLRVLWLISYKTKQSRLCQLSRSLSGQLKCLEKERALFGMSPARTHTHTHTEAVGSKLEAMKCLPHGPAFPASTFSTTLVLFSFTADSGGGGLTPLPLSQSGAAGTWFQSPVRWYVFSLSSYSSGPTGPR